MSSSKSGPNDAIFKLITTKELQPTISFRKEVQGGQAILGEHQSVPGITILNTFLLFLMCSKMSQEI
jgi:hypothetical protein